MTSPEGQKTEKVMVAAIDFGTTYSGYAYSFKHEYQDDPTKIIANTTWVSGHNNLFSLKTPTCLLLKPDKTFHSFGYQAEETYTELANENQHNDWYFFRRFKMLLHNNMDLNRDIEIPDETGKKMVPAITVFGHGIRYLKTHLMENLEKKGVTDLIGSDGEYIHWVLTMPAIWNDKAKQLMREAAKDAGIVKEKLSIALEPEAAALYCKLLPLEKLSSESDSNLSVFQPSTKFMVLDLGGGTVDVTVQEVLEDHTLKELHKASGGAWGGTYIDQAFLQLIISIVGSPIIKQFKDHHPADDLELVREFETKKRSVKADDKEKVTFRIPVSLSDLFEKEYQEELKSVIKQTKYVDTLSWTGDKLRMKGPLIKKLFKNCSESIVEHVLELLRNPLCRDVNTILMVGGFSECKVIQNAVKTNLPNKRVVIPEDAGLAIVKGAVLFGHNPTTIVSRKTKYTYGVETNRNFLPGDPESKKFQVNGIDKCRDVFSVHVEVDTTVPVGTPLEPRYYSPLYKDSASVEVPIYVSTDKCPQFTTDNTCKCLGNLTVKLEKSEKEDREIEVRMTFGGTELIVDAKEAGTEVPCVAEFDFLKLKL